MVDGQPQMKQKKKVSFFLSSSKPFLLTRNREKQEVKEKKKE